MKRYRIGFLALIVLFAAIPAYSYVSASMGAADGTTGLSIHQLHNAEEPVVTPREDVTVITNNQGPLVAFDPDGTVRYINGTYQDYWDIDPDPEGSMTVLYSASDDLDPDECPVDVECSLMVIERANLTTGEVERLFTRYYPGKFDNEWHDIDRFNDTHLVIGEMAHDQVLIVDTRTGVIDWAWDAQSHFPITKGGEEAELEPQGWPDDWTHLNDVEVLDDGRIMVSLRNLDQVVFLDPHGGVIDDWTLGADDDYDVLFEQHQPDYIPEEDGGPAVVIADSQNNRIVEYQRVEGEWDRTWTWTDPEMLWPRDADRLPSGHTLVTDTNSERVFEVDADGEIVWLVDLPGQYRPYEAERLGTGDESGDGPSAVAANLSSRGNADALEEPVNPKYDNPADHSIAERLQFHLRSITRQVVPNKILNGIVFVLPPWLGAADLLPLLLFGLTIVGWAGFELYMYQTAYTVELRSPIRVKR